jgi:sulfur carrier protein
MSSGSDVSRPGNAGAGVKWGRTARSIQQIFTLPGTVMQIVLNGENTAVSEGITLTELVGSLQLAGQRLAIELNGDIVPRSRWPEVRLSNGDRAEIVRAIGGG